MGKRLRVIKKHVEYGESAFFNWNYVDFHELLDVLSCGVETQEEDAGYYADDFECLKDRFAKALEIVKFHKENGGGEELKKMIYDNALESAKETARIMKNANVSRNPEDLVDSADEMYEKYNKLIESLEGVEYVYNAMQKFYEQCEENNAYISFSAF